MFAKTSLCFDKFMNTNDIALEKKILGRPTSIICPTSLDSQLSFKRSILPHTVFTQEAKPPKEITSSLWIIRPYIPNL